MNYFSIFLNNLTNHALIFLRVWTKNANCWEILRKFWKFYRKMEFLIIFGKFVTKNRALGNNTIFYNHFPGSGGGVPPSPLATPLDLSMCCTLQWTTRAQFTHRRIACIHFANLVCRACCVSRWRKRKESKSVARRRSRKPRRFLSNRTRPCLHPNRYLHRPDIPFYTYHLTAYGRVLLTQE